MFKYYHQSSFLSVLLSLAIGFAVLACDDHDHDHEGDDHDHGELSSVEEACLHLNEDSPVMMNAVGSASDYDETTTISASHTHYAVTLPEAMMSEEGLSYAGQVAIEIAEAGEYSLYISAQQMNIAENFMISVLTLEGETLGSISTDHSLNCTESMTTLSAVEFDLPVGRHDLIVAADQSEFSLVLEAHHD